MDGAKLAKGVMARPPADSHEQHHSKRGPCLRMRQAGGGDARYAGAQRPQPAEIAIEGIRSADAGNFDKTFAKDNVAAHEDAMKLFQTTVSRAVDLVDFSGGGAALTALERAEFQRQGAKAAMRGDPADANPMRQHLGMPDGAGKEHSVWAQRAAAWQAGYELQARALRDRRIRPGGEPDRDFE